jgi:hypothetical protein
MFPKAESARRPPGTAGAVKRGIVAVGAALACVALLTSCSLLQRVTAPARDDSTHQADVQMQHIADALRAHDAAGLKKLFSPRARAHATGLDDGVAYFLSIFPSGLTSWKIENGGPGGSAFSVSSKRVVESFAYYDVTANGHEYELVFVDVTTDTAHPDNIGIIGLGAGRSNAAGAPQWTAEGDPTPFYDWIDAFGIDNLGDTLGAPGVFVPRK